MAKVTRKRLVDADDVIVHHANNAANGAMAEIRIEDALHEITAPASGRLTILAAANTVVEPGPQLVRLARRRGLIPRSIR
jgi:hypothetical protein